MLKENSCSFIDHIISSQVILGVQTTFAVSFHESLTLTQGYSPCSQLCSWKARVLPSCFKPWYRSNPGAGDSPSERDPWEKAGGKERPVGTERRDLTNPAISAFHRKCSVSLFSHILCQFRHHMREIGKMNSLAAATALLKNFHAYQAHQQTQSLESYFLYWQLTHKLIYYIITMSYSNSIITSVLPMYLSRESSLVQPIGNLM